MAIDATVGGTNANSYVTLAEGNTYFDGRLHCSDWTSATDADKEKALIQATRIFNQYIDWLGLKTDDDQALQWPRKYVCNDGVNYFECGSSWLAIDSEYYWVVDSTTILQIIKDAECELALVLLSDDIQSGGDFSSLSVAGMKMEFDGSKGNYVVMPDHVWQIISGLGTMKGSTGVVKLMRC